MIPPHAPTLPASPGTPPTRTRTVTRTILLAGCLGLALLTACTPPGPGNSPSTSGRTSASVGRAGETSGGTSGGGPSQGPALKTLDHEPTVRIRIASHQAQTILSGPARLTVGSASPRARANPRRLATPLTVRHTPEGFLLTDKSGQSLRWPLPALSITAPSATAPIRVGTTPYAGELVIVPTGPDRFDVINHLPLETYLPGVLQREMYPTWAPEAFAAQAIAARSYALWERSLAGPGRAYDLESTVASQAYAGAATHTKAREAVRATRGQVLTYRGRVVPAFYSSCSGGTGQDAAAAFPGRVVDIPPLRGRDHGGWGQASPKFRWGPVTRPTATLSRRIAAWGRANRDPIAALGTLKTIQITERSGAGRPAVFTLTDTAGRRYRLACEHFRFACNFSGAKGGAKGGAKLAASQTLWSSHVTPRVTGASVRFTDGRGFGHGVGLDQWGAQAMATAGHAHRAVLMFYYPGAVITRAYD